MLIIISTHESIFYETDTKHFVISRVNSAFLKIRYGANLILLSLDAVLKRIFDNEQFLT